MTPGRAVWYRLFAAARGRRRSAAVRAATAILGMVGIGVALYRLTPQVYGAPFSLTQLFCILFIVVSLLGELTAVLTHGYIRSALHRLQPLSLLALSPGRAAGFRVMAFAPLIALAAAVSLPMVPKIFAGQAPPMVLVGFTVLSLAVVFARIVATRVGSGRTARLAQFASCMYLPCAASLVWQTLAPEGPAPWVYDLAICTGAANVVVAAYFWRRAGEVFADAGQSTMVWPVRRLMPSFVVAVRALRTGRYLGGNALLAALFGGLCLVSARSPGVLPFDGVALVVLFFAGTMGLEARAISRRRYPVELVYYGRVAAWVGSTWLLTLLNNLLVLGAVCAVAVLWFPGALGVSYAYCAGVGLCLAAAGAGTASLIVPQKHDILAQFAAAAAYGCAAWLVVRTYAELAPQVRPPAAIIFVAACFFITYVAEKVRWLLTIRRFYA